MSTPSPILARKRLFGVTHSTDGARIQRQVKVLKIGIGVPSQGPDVHVWMEGDEENPWRVEVGSYNGRSRNAHVQKFPTRAAAEGFYLAQRRSAPKCMAPRKLPYFTFLRQGMDGYVHDFNAIELHGPRPNEIDIVFLSEDIYDPQFAMYTATELKCHGDGVNALRKLSMATREQEPLVEIARAKGERYFPILNGCYTKGCPYPDKGECKPHARLYFQLTNSAYIALGGTCSFETTSYRSAAQIDICLEQIRTATGRGDPEKGYVAGIPLKLVLRPYKTAYTDNNTNQKRSSMAFAVHIEYRVANVKGLGQLIDAAEEYREVLQLTEGAARTEIGDDGEEVHVAQVVGVGGVELTEEQELLDARAVTAEFSSPEDIIGAGYDEFVPDAEPAATTRPARPRRKSQMQESGVGSREPVKTSAPPPLVIADVTFPDRILAETEEEKVKPDTYTLMTDEAQRMKVPLVAYCESVIGLKPSELTEGAAQALLKVMATAPSR